MEIMRAPRGMTDLFEPELSKWRSIESAVSRIFQIHGYQEIRTPILEDLALFKRGIGESSDIVEKEMFVVLDGEHSYGLRPENTAPVVRALIQRGGLSLDTQEKYFYLGPMFRKERPQKGRLRQFHQFGIESFGVSEAIAEIEVIAMVDQLFKELKLSEVTLKINSLGTREERGRYKQILKDFLSNKEDDLCEDCKRRLHINTLRVLDCKNPKCGEIARTAPKTLETMGEESLVHFNAVQEGLKKQGVAFEIDQQLVRGLDYYNRTVFEFLAPTGLGSQNAVAAGGRYDGLFSILGNKIDLPGVGCAGGIERIALLIPDDDSYVAQPEIKIALIAAGEAGAKAAISLGFALRKQGISADFCLAQKSLKAQMRRADKLSAHFVAVIGENEINNNKVVLKDMRADFFTELALNDTAIANFLISSS